VNEDRRQTPMAGNGVSEEDDKRSIESRVYQIRIKGHLDNSWSEWFEGLRMAYEQDGTTVLTGPVADQPALHGLLIKIRDLGLPLLSVNRVESDQGEARRKEKWR
jgi:hypothetical protein